MNVYVWQRVGRVTDRTHADGGVVVIAESLEAARAVIATATALPDAPSKCGALFEPPAYIAVCDGDPQLFIFPDAGCC